MGSATNSEPLLSKTRTVLVVLHEESLGGATIAVIRLVPFLDAQGWKLVFWASKPSAVFDHLESLGHPVEGAWRPLTYSFRSARLAPGVAARVRASRSYAKSLREFAEFTQAEVVHANSLLSTWEALFLKRRLRLPTVMHVHESLPVSAKGRLAASLARMAADEFAVPSRASAGPLARFGIEARVVHGAAPVIETRGRRSHAGEVVIGTVGTVSRRKGSDLFVRAAEQLQGRGLRFEMLGASDSPLEANWAKNLVDRAKRAGIAHREHADVEAAMREWDIFVMPSREDPFPNAILEAMASRLPVIATDVGGIPEQVTPETGVLVPPEDAAALAEAIVGVASSAEWRRSLGEAGALRVQAQFTLERQAEGLAAAYRRALGLGDGA